MYIILVSFGYWVVLSLTTIKGWVGGLWCCGSVQVGSDIVVSVATLAINAWFLAYVEGCQKHVIATFVPSRPFATIAMDTCPGRRVYSTLDVPLSLGVPGSILYNSMPKT